MSIVTGNPARGPGNWREHLEKLGRRVETISKYVNTEWDKGNRLAAVRFKVRFGTHGDILVVVTTENEGAKEVAFVSAPDFEDAVSTLGGLLTNGKLRYKPDEYANSDSNK